MLSIFICEDDKAQRMKMEKLITDYVEMENLAMKLVLSTDSPFEVLGYLQAHPKTSGLYFLDIDLGHEIDGIKLAEKVREVDSLGKIVFVTTHGEMSYLIFKYKIEALDYILKDHPDEMQVRVRECITMAHKRYADDKNPDKKVYTVKIGEQFLTYPHDDIMFIEASPKTPHRLILHLKNGQSSYYGTLKDTQAATGFYLCHKSVLVNPDNVKEINTTTREAELVNGDICLVSARAMKGLKALVR